MHFPTYSLGSFFLLSRFVFFVFLNGQNLNSMMVRDFLSVQTVFLRCFLRGRWLKDGFPEQSASMAVFASQTQTSTCTYQMTQRSQDQFKV